MELIVETQNLTKKYGIKSVVDDVRITIKKGQIYGLIGTNGAGKTTLMRLLCGLVKPTEGSISLFHEQCISTGLKKVGFSVDFPTLYPGLNAYENMMAQAILLGKDNRSNIIKYLNLVGLTDMSKKVKKYSLGMKQRLMIALTLIGEPEFLILDEPMNGLDPLGIRLIRELLLKLNKENKMTIMISSHMLDELSKISDVYGIMESGKLIKEITKEELLCTRQNVFLEVDDLAKANDILKSELKPSEYGIDEKNHRIVLNKINSQACLNTINFKLLEHGISIKRIAPLEEGIEDYFWRIMEETKSE
ncbi:MAG: ABC transporter ATP-binding protein [Lachnospiraceae bacterium]|nr:ABC transporter ATP-binding protein [Lachnospiraceae bacterium]